jgi:hypothetical protein
MRSSDIFDEFAKIAIQRGIISIASSDDNAKKLEENPRADSLDLDAIESLYEIKTETPDSMKYKKNIIEDAHPTSAIVAPAYDKLNGLVENVNERQNIILNIMNKMPTGQVTNKKYAQQELLLSLVRIGNDLDNQHKDELRVLADVCLEQTYNLNKQALLPFALPPLVLTGIIAVPVLLGAIYLQQHLDFINEGFEKNHQKLISEIDDLLNSSSSWGIGRDYTKDLISEMKKFKQELITVYNDVKKISPILKSLEKARTGKELLELANSPVSESVINAYNILKRDFTNIKPVLLKVKENFDNEIYKINHIQEKGWLEQAVDWTHVLHGGLGLIADDFDDVFRAIDPYKTSVEQIIKILEDAGSLEKNAKNQLESLDISTNKNESTTKIESEPVIPENKIKTIEDSAKELEQELGEMSLP